MRAIHALAIGTLIACAPRATVRPDDLSASEHRREAAAERARADDQAARYDPNVTATTPSSFQGLDRQAPLFPVEVYWPFNPTLRHLDAAAEHARHAREHEQAAAELEAFEETECRGFPPTTRAACPMLGPVRIEDLPDGVRLYLPERMPVDATLAHMRCHLAYARARAYAPSASCPLYVRGTEIRRAPESAAIDLTSKDAAVARKLRRLARGQAD